MARAVIAVCFSQAGAARAYGVSPKIVARWVERYKAGGRQAMLDRSSRPHGIPRKTGQALTEHIIALRRQRLTGRHVAIQTGVSPATVSRILKRARLSRLKDLEPAAPIVRYEYPKPGGLIHLDIKRLGRFERVGHRITGDSSCYRSKDFAAVCRQFGLKHIRTKPYTSKTNGKAERFTQTALWEWAYARTYRTSQQRKQQLPVWTHMYNWHRPHGSLNSIPPISRLDLTEDNLLRLHS